MHLNRKRTSNPVGCKIMDAWSPMSLEDQIRQAIEQEVPDSTVEVVANGSHFSLKVISPVFEGKKTLEKQRMVLNFPENRSMRPEKRSPWKEKMRNLISKFTTLFIGWPN